jgi:hypothetical protein
VWNAGFVDNRQRRALLRLYSGEAPEDICADLSITMHELADWDRTIEPEQLRPDGLGYVSSTLATPQAGVPRTNLGMRIGPPERSAEAVQRVHLVGGPSDPVCLRCGDEVLPRHFEPHSPAWPAFVLVQQARQGSSVRLVTKEEADLFPACAP